MTEAKRRLGFEQEFFLVDETGAISHLADEFLSRCQAIATEKGSNPNCFAPEWVKHIVEINTNPVNSVSQLTQEYFSNLQIAIQAGQDSGLRLYPLSTYPLHVMPIIRNKLWYHVQLRTVGYDRFLHAGRCTGTHLHLEVEPGAIEPRIGVSYDATPAAKAEILNLFNLATALDAALIAISRACPFYEGRGMNVSAHTVHYRGRDIFGWEGVYTNLQAVGGLQPYVHSVEELVELQFERYHAWLSAMDRAGVERHLFYEAGGSLLKTAWNRVRLNKIGTIELRGTDSNYPDRILAIATLVSNSGARVRRENLTVRPKAGVKTFQLSGDRLDVPEFEYLDNDLLYAAVTEGVKNREVKDYLDSIFEFATQDGEGTNFLTKMRSDLGEYQTTEAELLQEFPTSTGVISPDEGLRLVRQACDKLEQQVLSVVGSW